MSMTFGTPFDTSVKTLQNRVYEMSGCTSCLQTICPGIPIVWGRYVRVYELSLDQMSKQTKCQGVRNVMGVRNVLLPIFLRDGYARTKMVTGGPFPFTDGPASKYVPFSLSYLILKYSQKWCAMFLQSSFYLRFIVIVGNLQRTNLAASSPKTETFPCLSIGHKLPRDE